MKNKAKIYEESRKNFNLNENGQPAISKNDIWFYEDMWVKNHKKMSENK